MDKFTVWVGGTEWNDYYISKEEAITIKSIAEKMGYSDVIIEKIEPVIHSKESLFQAQAPSWNFELNAEQLLAKALELGFVEKIGDDKYLQNDDYINLRNR